jgi:hypothetical protein
VDQGSRSGLRLDRAFSTLVWNVQVPGRIGATEPRSNSSKSVVLQPLGRGGPMSKDIQDVSTVLEGMVRSLAPSLVSVIGERLRGKTP